jgi:YHS domain-containing protein
MTTFLHRCIRAIALFLLCGPAALAGDFFEAEGFALRGYDPVAYVETNAPVRGSAAHTFEYKGSKFLFESAANREKFAADPTKYAPQYGGFCALGTANGYKVSTQPDAFKVVDGKLYFNYDRKVLELWSKDIPGYLGKADANWPEVSRQPRKD